MVSSFESSSIVASIILLFLLVTPSSCTNNTISELCGNTRDPAYCQEFMRYLPATDLKALAKTVISIAHNSASRTQLYIGWLAKHAINPQLKQHYMTCSKYYTESLREIDLAQKYLASGDYKGVNIVAGAMDNAGYCDIEIRKPPADSSLLNRANRELENICSIIMAIASELIHHVNA
ncbi:PMEI domain-containing protein [Cephalotus follicularis]|uniref:PMEI domain-containing protein n=1 Tax=Cephalotus follicularis TaxID=3775 RepID=A0A1Q3BUR4_CEPFO|nr:PMEI domain-containing protein [Cephalotus follicularis]